MGGHGNKESTTSQSSSIVKESGVQTGEIVGSNVINVSGVDGPMQLSDYGAIEEALDYAKYSGEEAFGFAGEVVDYAESSAREAFDYGEYATREAFDYGEYATREAFDYGEYSAGEAFDFGGQIVDAGQAIVNEALARSAAMEEDFLQASTENNISALAFAESAISSVSAATSDAIDNVVTSTRSDLENITKIAIYAAASIAALYVISKMRGK